MSDDTRGSGDAGVCPGKYDIACTRKEAETQRLFSDLLTFHGVDHYREVWFRPMASVSVLDTQTKARRVDFYINATDPDYGPYTVVVEIKQRRESGIYKELRAVTAQLIGARSGFGWFTQSGFALPAPDWPVYANQYRIAGVDAPENASRPHAEAYAERQWWENGCGTLFRDHRGLMVRVPGHRFNRGARTPDVKYHDLRLCP